MPYEMFEPCCTRRSPHSPHHVTRHDAWCAGWRAPSAVEGVIADARAAVGATKIVVDAYDWRNPRPLPGATL